VRPFLAAADFVVVPLTRARGVQNKVLEAMAMARPVLLTREAATGIDAGNDRDWLLCDADPGAFAKRVDDLRANPDWAAEVCQNARQFVIEHHDWEAMLAPLNAMINLGSEEARNAA
jgi:glycosyltransferase involved in cell wall biosynthesis